MEQSDALARAVDFSELILGFSSAALYYLGQSVVEGKKVPAINLPIALQNIEIVALLEEKTKGNLSADEAALLQQVLADLRQKYRDLNEAKSAPR